MKFYCEYCKSYLTHDKLSVRKSHLQGRNHIRLYCNYYTAKLKELGLDALLEYETTIDEMYSAAPGFEEIEEKTPFKLPPPKPLKGLPPPPPSALYNESDKALYL